MIKSVIIGQFLEVSSEFSKTEKEKAKKKKKKNDVCHGKAVKKVVHGLHHGLWHEKVHDSAFLNTGMKPGAAFCN